MSNNYPPGITEHDIDRQFGETSYELPKSEIERRKKIVAELGLSLENPFIRVWVGSN